MENIFDINTFLESLNHLSGTEYVLNQMFRNFHPFIEWGLEIIDMVTLSLELDTNNLAYKLPKRRFIAW